MPYAAEIHLTYRCDLACRTCNRACFVKPQLAEDMTVEAFDSFLREAVQLGIPLKFIILLGGEPTLHRDLQQFIDLSKKHVKKFDGEVEVFSNGFGSRTKEILNEIRNCRDGLCRVVDWTAKPGGSVEFGMNTLFVSPLDVGMPRQKPCSWHSCFPNVERVSKRATCGISVDSQGYAVCPLGGAISRVIAPHAITRQLKDLLDKDYVAWQTNELCKHCGAQMTFPPEALNGIPRIAGTLMSPTWADGFRRLEMEGLRLVDGLADGARQ